MDDIDRRVRWEEQLAHVLAGASFAVIASCEFGPGLVGVHDSTDEWDVYFDTLRWEAIDPRLWTDGDGFVLQPPGLRATEVGVLEGVGTVPQPRNFDDLEAFARRHLRRFPNPQILAPTSPRQ